MIKKILKGLVIFIGIVLFLILLMFAYFNLPVKNDVDNANLGVTFSKRYAEDIGLNWKDTYVALLDDLGIKKVRIPVYWDWFEPSKGEFDFSDVDWQLEEARKRNAEVILAIGQKVPRWPECYVPKWVENDEERKERLLSFIEVTMKRYREGYPEIKYWQIENEPFLAFGVCPPIDPELVDKELELARSLDSTREFLVTDSGELSTWIPAAKRADVFGTTMYRNVYKEGFGYYVYPLGPNFFRAKQWLIEKFANQEDAIVVELQGEPWIAGWTTNFPLEEQFKSMNENKLRENIEYAKTSGFSDIYLWGVEWWYWLKIHHDHPELWEEMRSLLEENQVK